VRPGDLTSDFTTVRIYERGDGAEMTHHNHQTKNLQAKGDTNPKKMKAKAVFCIAEVNSCLYNERQRQQRRQHRLQQLKIIAFVRPMYRCENKIL
jgi:hypothetical protein